MVDNRILYNVGSNSCMFRLIGQIRYAMSSGFNAAIEMVFKNSAIEKYIIDLSETAYIDSTNLGLIAKIARYCMDRGFEKPVIISNNNEVSEVLKSMGFEQAFFIFSSSANPEESDFVQVSGTSDKKLKEIMLEAHELLMEMNESNHSKFKNVVELLKKTD